MRITEKYGLLCSSYSTDYERIRLIHIIGFSVIHVVQNNTDCGLIRTLRRT